MISEEGLRLYRVDDVAIEVKRGVLNLSRADRAKQAGHWPAPVKPAALLDGMNRYGENITNYRYLKPISPEVLIEPS